MEINRFVHKETAFNWRFKVRKVGLSGLLVTCNLDRVLMRVQLFPLDPLIDFSFSGLEYI